MDTSLYPSNNVSTLQAIAGANPFNAGLLDLPDRQPAAYQPSSAVQPDASAVMLRTFPISAPTIANIANSNGWAAKEVWAKYQADIEQLYLHERKTLAEVMRLIKSKHGFKATVKMYKTYITKWGLDKKNKEPEMRAIVRKYKQRENQGKKSRICVRKQQRNFADVVRYWERKGKSIDDIIARQTASPTPEAVEVSTPLTSPILTIPELTTPERMLRCIRDYIRGSFESGTWVHTEPTSRCYSIKDNNRASDRWVSFSQSWDLACELFQRGLFHEAGDTLISTTGKSKNTLSGEHPDNLAELENTLQPDDFRVCTIRGYLADEYFEVGRYDDAMTLIQKNIVYAQDPSSMSAESYDHSYDLYVLAKCQHALGDVDLGIATLRQATDLIMSIWGLQESRARRWLLRLEDWYVDQGLWDSAAQARERRFELLASIDTD